MCEMIFLEPASQRPVLEDAKSRLPANLSGTLGPRGPAGSHPRDTVPPRGVPLTTRRRSSFTAASASFCGGCDVSPRRPAGLPATPDRCRQLAFSRWPHPLRVPDAADPVRLGTPPRNRRPRRERRAGRVAWPAVRSASGDLRLLGRAATDRQERKAIQLLPSSENAPVFRLKSRWSRNRG